MDHRFDELGWCNWCGRKLFFALNGKGRLKRYCNHSCRQAAYRERQEKLRAAEDDDEIDDSSNNGKDG